MKDRFAVSMFGQKRLSREGGIEIVVKELCTRMARDGCQVTCYNRSGHHVSGAEYDNKIEYDGIRQKFVPTIEGKGLAAVSSSFFAALYSAFGKYDVVHIHAEGPAFFSWLPKMFRKRVVVTIHGIDWQREKWKSGFGSKFIRQGEKNAVKYADEIIVLSKGVQDYFKDVIGDRIASICKSHNVTVDYAFQDINDIPGELPEGRTKPWGTGQAVLAAKNVIDTPFIVINADDYYGKEGFKAVHEYLVNGGKSCMAGFVLKNTLSDNGGVTRGICKMDENGNLTEVVETKNIVKTPDGAEADGMVVDVNSLVSMNMWGLTPDFLDVLEEGFKEFFEKEVPSNPQKAEYLIPIFIGELLEQGKMSVKVLKTNDTWYGMTYLEDVATVKDSFKKMLENGVYKADLFSDL